MVYEWDHVKDECYRLYVTEKKALDELIDHFHSTQNFVASRRAFQVQFKKWGFPPRRTKPTEELKARIRELWKQNYGSAEQRRILQEEGYETSEAQLRRLRTQMGFFLREHKGPRNVTSPWMQTGLQEGANDEGDGGNDRMDVDDDDEDSDDDNSDEDEDGQAGETGEREEPVQRIPGDVRYEMEQNLTPLERAQREQRRIELEAQSHQLWATKKRRRRIRGHGPLGADPEGMPPRYVSETSISESKAALNLDKDAYQSMRQEFQRICEEEGIMKKTHSLEKWEAAKERLIRGSMHLRAIMYEPSPQMRLAVDQICCDVVKRIRQHATGLRISLIDARRILGVDPEQGRELRFALTKILADDRFVGKLEAGKEHWEELKAQWLAMPCAEPIRRALVAAEESDAINDNNPPALLTANRSIDVLTRDVMRRWVDRNGNKAREKAERLAKKAAREAQKRAEAERAVAQPPTPAAPKPPTAGELRQARQKRLLDHASALGVTESRAPRIGSRGRPPKWPLVLPPEQAQPPPTPAPGHSNARLVPVSDDNSGFDDGDGGGDFGSPLPSPSNQGTPGEMSSAGGRQQGHQAPYGPGGANPFVDARYVQAYHQAAAQIQQRQGQQQQMYHQPVPAPVHVPMPPAAAVREPPAQSPGAAAAPVAIPAYFRLHPLSTVPTAPPVSWIGILPSRSFADLRAVAAQQHGGTYCTAVEGVVKHGPSGGEFPLPVGDDEELAAYLAHLGGKGPTFSVQLVIGATGF